MKVIIAGSALVFLIITLITCCCCCKKKKKDPYMYKTYSVQHSDGDAIALDDEHTPLDERI